MSYLISFTSLVDGQVSSPFGSGSWWWQEIDGPAVGAAQLPLVLNNATSEPKTNKTNKSNKVNKNKSHSQSHDEW